MNCNTHWNLAPSPNQAGCPHCLTLPLLVQPCGACASRDIVIKELRADLIAERSAHKEKRMLEAELAAQAEACRVYREALEEIEGSLTDWREGLDYNMEVLRAIARKALEPKGEKI